MPQQPNDLDDDRRVVQPFRLPEHMRREPPPIPEAQQQRPPQQRSFLNDLEYAIRHDPLKQIAATVCSLRFPDTVKLAAEICSLERASETPLTPEDAEVVALRFAMKLYRWAEAKFPPHPSEPQNG